MSQVEVARPVGVASSDAFVVARREDLQRSRRELLASVEQSDLLDSLRAELEHALAEVDGALARIEAGTFGRCSACGEAIPGERLEAMPAAELCVPCRHEQETRAF
jgi:DnaK suppressor protein